MRSFVVNGPYTERYPSRGLNCILACAWMLTSSQIHPLTALMSLLSCLAISLTSFCPLLLSQRQANFPAEQSTPKILQLLHEIVRDNLIPPKPPDEDYPLDVRALGKETLNLLDALCWRTPDEHVEKFVSSQGDRIILTNSIIDYLAYLLTTNCYPSCLTPLNLLGYWHEAPESW